MRIIAGEFRGRKILPPAGMQTRPVTDRVKQSIFDWLADLLPEAVVYDCFAGTGSMGLECLSRGAQSARFYESDASSAAILRSNIGALGVGDRSRVIVSNLFTLPEFKAQASPSGSGKCSLVFLDPPYRFLSERPDDLRRLAQSLVERHLAPGAMVVFRHAAGDALDLAPLERYDERGYGGMAVEFLRCPSNRTNFSPPPIPPG